MDKIVIITGGANGLGLAIAKDLLKENHHVIIFDIDDSEFERLTAQGFICYKVDVTNEKSVLEAVKSLVENHGQVDILVNSAGVIHSKALVNIMSSSERRHSYEEFQKVININLNSVFLVGSILAEHMLMNRTKGVIINISSISAKGNPGQSAYAASKAGIEALTRVWAKELGPFGIRTNSIAPGFIDTPSTEKALSQKSIEDIKKRTPLKKLGTIQNIVQSTKYIIENDFVNGTVVEVDGGLVI